MWRWSGSSPNFSLSLELHFRLRYGLVSIVFSLNSVENGWLVFICVEENQTAEVTFNACYDLYGKNEAINDNAWIPVPTNQLHKSRKSAKYENLLTNQLIKLHRCTHLTIIEEATNSLNSSDKSNCVVCKPSQPMNQESSQNKQLSESSNHPSLLRNYQTNKGKPNKHLHLVEMLACAIPVLINRQIASGVRVNTNPPLINMSKDCSVTPVKLCRNRIM